MSRGICQYTKVRSSSEINLTCVNASLETIFSYIWVHLEHPMDAVRHLASESLANVVLLGRKYPGSVQIYYTVISVILKFFCYYHSLPLMWLVPIWDDMQLKFQRAFVLHRFTFS